MVPWGAWHCCTRFERCARYQRLFPEAPICAAVIDVRHLFSTASRPPSVLAAPRHESLQLRKRLVSLLYENAMVAGASWKNPESHAAGRDLFLPDQPHGVAGRKKEGSNVPLDHLVVVISEEGAYSSTTAQYLPRRMEEDTAVRSNRCKMSRLIG